jgi:tetratricopeptide (TPR) repeat protein
MRRFHQSTRLPLAGLATAMSVFLSPVLPGQAPQAVAPAQFDPSDVYFQGFLAARTAEQLETAGDFIGAMEKLKKARQMFEAVVRYYPEWKPDMVRMRMEKTVEAVKSVQAKADAQLAENRNQVAELEGGLRQAGKLVDPSKDVIPLTPPGILEVDPLATRRLSEAQAEVRRLKALNPRNSADRASSQTTMAQELKAAQANVEALRKRLAVAPLEKDLVAMNKRIENLEQERRAMSMALDQSRGAHTEALARIGKLEADLKETEQKRADLKRDLDVQSSVANSVVAGQRRQLDALEKQLSQKTAELTKANERIHGLVVELQESRDAFDQLRGERDSLLMEKEHMAALLKLNEASRIQDLIEQNMGLAKNLREANEKVERLNLESNKDKDAINMAQRDLAIAKAQINRLHQDKREQDKRIAELEARLKNEEKALAEGKSSADPAEVAVLRGIIKEQLRKQERQRQARELLVQAAKELGRKDSSVARAIELLDGQALTLTPEELAMLDDRRVDGEFVSPFARDRASVLKDTEALGREIAVFERTAEKSFVAGRLVPTRELYQMILDQNPGHTPSLCRLGVVHLKLEEPAEAVETFRRAVELDPANPYAYRMLGFSLMRIEDLPAAEQAVRRAVDLAPNDAKSLSLLASLCYRMKRIGEAESFFKGAISADPMLNEPYYNLALICVRDGRLEQAKTYYEQALDREAVPDPDLEQKFYKQ